MTAGSGLPGGPTRSTRAEPVRAAAPRTPAAAPVPVREPVRAPGDGPWPCYWLERTGLAEVGLRRYAARPGSYAAFTCDAGWHDARAWLGVRVPYEADQDGHYPSAEEAYAMPVDRSRSWPRECARGCGYRFTARDARQVWCEPVYRAADGTEFALHWEAVPPGLEQAGPGAMWHAPWMARFQPNPGKPDDGVHLMVRCPDLRSGRSQDWCPDSAASSGGFWTRTGDPRRPETLTVAPSIALGEGGADYHGFLQSGVLTRHVG